jgi:hypothetical protein
MSNYIQSSKAKLVAFLVNKENFANFATNSLQGNVFEQYAHQQLSKGGQFKYRSLEAGSCQTYHLNLPQRSVIYFYNIEECVAKETYYVPLDPKLACIDAYAPSVGFFQTTINVNHPIPKVKMADLVIATAQTHLFFVVPDYLYGSYSKQTFQNISCNNADKGDKGMSKRRKGCIEEVKQFVLCIPPEIP